jgi:hypothetical protein
MRRALRRDEARARARGAARAARRRRHRAAALRDFIARYDRRGRCSTSTRLLGLRGRLWRTCSRRADFERLAEQLGGIRGQFILSINDTPEIREIFGRFELEEVETTYSIGTKTPAPASASAS